MARLHFMEARLRRGCWGICLLVVVLGAAAPTHGVTGLEVVERVQERMRDYRTFTAHFEKEFHWAALDKTSRRQGRIYLKRPNRFRVEIEDGSIVVADGEAIWAYSRANEQVIVSPYQGELRTPWEVLVEYADTYSPVAVEEGKLGKAECYLLVLRPDVSASDVAQMKVWVDRKRGWLLRVEQLESTGNLTTYSLTDHKANGRLDDEVFEFMPPEGVDLIDRRPPAGD